ncbi:hypothetical protein KC960_05660 [Candidatus Saccharibacteria bacterium]|nr:hypothetical protein [Candidatus Saccharibacteria bacterium]
MNKRLRIVFIAEHPGERPAKLAYGLRCKGVSCLLIHISDLNFNTIAYFDYSIRCYSPAECVEIARRLSPDIIHIFSFHTDQTALAVINQGLDCKIVYDYKDIFENTIAYPFDPILWQGQRTLIERADGLCCRDRQIDHYCKVNSVNLNNKCILFLDYCYGMQLPLANKTIKANEIHVVFHGSMIPEDMLPQYSCNGFYLIAEAFVQQKVHVHVYPGTFLVNHLSSKNNPLFKQLEKNNHYFHLHSFLALEDLLTTISQYDFGIILHQGGTFGIPDRYVLDGHHAYGMSTRLFDYLEAGLDVLVQDNFTMVTNLLQQYKFGKIVDSSYILSDLKDKLLELKNDALRKEQIAQARADLAVEKHTSK